MTEDEQRIAEFEAAGEQQVRLHLANKRYGETEGWKHRLAMEWVRQKEAARAATAETEQLDLNRRATEAAEAAANSARLANQHSKTANKIAVGAAIVAAAALVVSAAALLGQ
jgi:hypothetical protein